MNPLSLPAPSESCWCLPPIGQETPAVQAKAPTESAEAPLLLLVLDALAIGVMLLGSDGRLQLANRAARAWCVAAQPISIVGDELRVPPEHRSRLAAALQAARGGQWTMVALGAPGGPPWYLALLPVFDEADDGPCRVLAVLGAPTGVSELGLRLFGRHHRFSPAEMSVLQALATGASPAQIALDGEVALSTVRTQITALREKAQAPSLRHLLLMLASVPPISTLV